MYYDLFAEIKEFEQREDVLLDASLTDPTGENAIFSSQWDTHQGNVSSAVISKEF